MGWNNLLILVAICVLQRANGECQCDNAPKESKFSNTPVLVMSPTTTKSFPDEDSACFMDSGTCEVPVAYTGVDGNAMGFQPSISECDRLENGNVTMVDGTGKTLETITVDDCTSGRALAQLPSQFTVIFYQTKDANKDAMIFVLFLQPVKAATTTTSTTTTTPATTTTYSGNMTNDPTTFEIDLAVVIDSSYISDAKLYKNMKFFGRYLVDSLEVHINQDSDGGTRLSLASMTAKQGGPIGLPWTFEKEDFQNMVQSIPMGMKNTGHATYLPGITTLLDEAFAVDKGNPSRKRAQRVLVVITAQDSIDENPGDGIQKKMDEYDVWPILVSFSAEPKLKNIEDTLKRLSDDKLKTYQYNPQGTAKSEADHFFENYILRGSELCGKLNVVGTAGSDAGPYVIKTAHYEDIVEGMQTTGQKGRYCNYQNETAVITGFTATTFIKLNVVYELEVEHDYLRIYDGKGDEQAAFTGFDVKGTEICFESDRFKIYFTTNQKNVYGGFKIDAKGVNNCQAAS